MSNVPGSNLLNQAFGLIARQTVSYYRNTGRTKNAVGQYVAALAEPVSVQGSFQPVPRSRYQVNGPDLQKSYFNLFVPQAVIDLQREVSGDELVYNGRRYKCQSSTPWFSVDGWTEVLCVDIGAEV